MIRRWKLAVSLCFLFSAALASACEPGDDLGSKREWSMLQVADHVNRDRDLSADRIVLYSKEEYRMVGIASKDRSRRVWVLLNPKYAPVIKESPKLDYYLAPGEVARILEGNGVHPDVSAHLKGKVRS